MTRFNLESAVVLLIAACAAGAVAVFAALIGDLLLTAAKCIWGWIRR